MKREEDLLLYVKSCATMQKDIRTSGMCLSLCAP